MNAPNIRLGELLLRHGWVTAEALQSALANQVTYGGRLGTNLIELESLRLDKVGEALAAQHGVHAAPPAMLEAVTPETRRLVRSDFCAAKGVLPLRYDQSTVGYEPNVLHLAMLDPQRTGEIEQMMRAGDTRVVGYAVPQLRLLYYLERYYNVPRAKRYLRVGDSNRRQGDDRRHYLAPTVPAQTARFTVPPAATPDHTGPVYPTLAPQPRMQSGTYPPAAGSSGWQGASDSAGWDGRTGPIHPGQLAAPAPGDFGASWDGRTGPIQAPEPEPDDGLVYLDQIVRDRGKAPDDVDLDVDIDICFDDDDRVSEAEAYTVQAALGALQAATSRDEVIQCLVRPVFEAASLNVVFMPRGDLAVAAAAWGTEVPPTRVGQLVVPLNIPSLLKRAIDSRVAIVGQNDDDTLQEMIAVYLRVEPPKQVCVAPIHVAGRLISVICSQTTDELPPSAVADLTRLGQGAELAFARLLAQVAPEP